LSTYTLDFSLTTELDRCSAISEICAITTYTPTQYTQMADYILLANDKQDNFTIYPEEFNSPHKERDHASLDELMDDPFFEDSIETHLHPISKSIYRTCKRKVDRNNQTHISIPNMQQLWHDIDSLSTYLDEHPTSWRAKRLLIDLRKQQYTLLESVHPNTTPTSMPQQKQEYYQWYAGIPLSNGTTAHLDLCNPSHMAKFLIHLPALTEYCSSLSCDLAELLSDTNQAIINANLSPFLADILLLYQKGWSGKQILAYIAEHHNRHINQPYLSVIFNKQIASKIAEEYSEIYYSRIYANDPSKWRICLCCKQKKLLNKKNFLHFSNKPGGFSLICKECTKKNKGNNHDYNQK